MPRQPAPYGAGCSLQFFLCWTGGISCISGTVLFDRGFIDAGAALKYASGRQILQFSPAERYNPLLFLTPP